MGSKPQEHGEQLRKKLINLVCLSLLFATGCRYTPTSKMEFIDSSVVNQAGSSRVTVLRESTNAALTSPWIFVYLTNGPATFNKKPGDRIVTDQIAFEISGAWPVRAVWLDDTHLRILCDGCGAPLSWASKKKDRVGNVEVTYVDFPAVPHQLQEDHQDNPGGTLRAEQFYYTLPDTQISDSTTVRIEPLPLEYNKKLERINGNWPEDILELAKTGPLALHWADDKTLVVSCGNCGRKLSDASNKRDSVYGVHVRFEGFGP
jgi:hypothetical protein